MSANNPKTAGITLYPYLPREADQLAGVREWGLPELQDGGNGRVRQNIFFDDVRKVKANRWTAVLERRNDLLNVYRNYPQPDDQVFFANPLCVGWSEKMAKGVLDVTHGAGALAYIHVMAREFRPGDDQALFWAEHKRQLKNAQQGKWRDDARANK